MRYRFIGRARVHYPVTVLCRLLAVSRSSYSAWRPGHESQRMRENRQLLAHIRAIYTRAKQRYGRPRIHDALRGQGGAVGRHRVARLTFPHPIASAKEARTALADLAKMARAG